MIFINSSLLGLRHTSLLCVRQRFVIPIQGKLRKERKVRRIHDTPGGNVEAVHVTRIVIHQILIRRRHLHRHTDHHLCDLGRGDDKWRHPRRFHLECHEAIIAVHDGMHGVVHGHKVERLGCLRRKRVPAIQQDSDVVVPVEKQQRAFAGHDKGRVNEFGNLRKHEQLHPKAGCPRSPRSRWIPANGIRQGCFHAYTIQEFRYGAHGAHVREQRQSRIPVHQRIFQIKSLIVGAIHVDRTHPTRKEVRSRKDPGQKHVILRKL